MSSNYRNIALIMKDLLKSLIDIGMCVYQKDRR